MQDLYDKIEDGLWQDGLDHKEIRRFTPHITLARVKQSTTISEFKNFLTWSITGHMPIDYVQLQESVLEKTGPTYFALSSFDL